jgi:predicted transcriptional regulator
MTIPEAARRVNRDVKAVHGDVQELLNAGMLHRNGRSLVFPYDAVHVDFMLTKAVWQRKASCAVFTENR